jgi:prevent-host-death family protein
VEQQIPVRELNQRTSAILARVAQGEAVTITRDGRPIARLVPIASGSPYLDRVVEAGLAIAPSVEGPLPMPPRTAHPEKDVAALLVSDREHERA